MVLFYSQASEGKPLSGEQWKEILVTSKAKMYATLLPVQELLNNPKN